MKKYLFILFSAMLLSLGVFAKTYSYDLIPPENLDYTLPEYEDALKCTVFIEESGIFEVRIKAVSTTGEFPEKITVSLSHKGDEISVFSTKSDEFDENKYHLVEGLSEGEYTLKIVNDTKFSAVTFSIETLFTPYEHVEEQKGDGKENATKLKFSDKYFGGVMFSDSSDIYTFTMEKDGYAVIDMYSAELKHFTLSDEYGNEIGTMDIKLSDPKTVFETRCGLKKGTYYISVSPEDDYLSPLYSLEVFDYYDAEFETEYNNISSSATPLRHGKEFRGNLFGYDDVDFYTFKLDKKSSVKAVLTDKYLNKDNHYRLTLYDENNNEISLDNNKARLTFDQVLDKGTYYLSVSCPDERDFTPFGYSVKLTVKAMAADNTDSSETDKEESENSSEDAETSDENNTEIIEETKQFSDVNEGDWYAEDLLEARKLKLIEGVDSDNFDPSGNVTVAQAVTMAARLYSDIHGVEITTETDEQKFWYSHYVAFAYAAGIIVPGDFDSFDRPATRAEMAYIFAGAINKANLPDTTAEIIEIPDVPNNHRYWNEIQLLYKHQILNGNDDKGTFFPDNNVSRAESAVILLRCAKLLDN